MTKDEATNEDSLSVQPAQEPVAFMAISEDGICEEISHIGHHYDGVFPDIDDLIPLYTHPAPAHPPSWRRLSKKKLGKIYGDSTKIDWYAYEAIDEALKKLNHF